MMKEETRKKLMGLVGKELRCENDYAELPCSWSTVRKYMEIEVVHAYEVVEEYETLEEIAELLNSYEEAGGYEEKEYDDRYRYEVINNKIVEVYHYTKSVIKGFKEEER